MDADKDCILLAVEQTPAVDTPAALLEGDIVILRNEEFGIIAPVLKIQNYSSCDFAVEEGFMELPVWGTFAWSELTVAVVDEDFHGVAVLVQLSDSNTKVHKRFIRINIMVKYKRLQNNIYNFAEAFENYGIIIREIPKTSSRMGPRKEWGTDTR